MASEINEVFIQGCSGARRREFMQEWNRMIYILDTQKKASQGEYDFMSSEDYKEFMLLCEEKEID